MVPQIRSQDELHQASKKLHISLHFLNRVWFALDDTRTSDFSSAALLCEPYMNDYYSEDSGTSVDAKSIISDDDVFHCISDDESDASFNVTTSDHFWVNASASCATSESRSCSPHSVHEKAGDITHKTAHSSKDPPEASPRKPARKALTLPFIKGRPVGVTGFRFIHEHKFQTKNTSATFYNGFNLQFPKMFGLKTAKAKDITRLVYKRNHMLEIWALRNTRHSKREVAKWISEID